MTIVRLQTVDSSQISEAGYDPESQTLAIRFYRGHGRDQIPGSLYHYSNVTQEDYDAFLAAESKGAHFGRHIKPHADKFPFQKIVEGDVQQEAA